MTKHTVCPRAFRLMLALLSAPRTREECDKLAPSSNSPHYIGVLREKVKLEVPCEYVPFVTSDGIKSRYAATMLHRMTKPRFASICTTWKPLTIRKKKPRLGRAKAFCHLVSAWSL